MLDVIIRRSEQILAAQVDTGDLTGSVGFPYQRDVPVAVNIKVSGPADGLKNGYALAFNSVGSGSIDFAQNGKFEVHDLNIDGGIPDVVIVLESSGNVGGQLGAGFARSLHFADDGQDDAALGIHQISFGFVTGGAAGGTDFRHGKGGGELRLLAADCDIELVILLDGCLVVCLDGFPGVSGNILDIEDFLGADAGGQESGSGHGQGAQNGFIDEVVCIHLVREEETLLLGGKMVIKIGKEAIPAQRIFFLGPEAPREWRDALHAFNLPEV